MTTNINVRVDSQLKSQAEQIFSALGLNLSSAITVFLSNAVRYQGIPFELRLETPNEITLRTIDEVNRGVNLLGPFHTMEALMEELNADD